MSYSSSAGLLSVGGVTIPMKYMKAESYIVTRSVTDLDSFRDADGKLHRNALSHVLYKVEFNTPPMLTNTDVKNLMSIFQAAYTVPKERKLVMTAYIPEIDDYITQDAYIPDPAFTIYWVNGK